MNVLNIPLNNRINIDVFIKLSLFKYTLFALLISSLSSCFTAAQSIHEIVSTNKIIDFEIDKIGNQYSIYDNGDIYKSDPNQKIISNCNFNNLGTLYALDVTNPQKILAFYKDFQIIIILDNSLSELSRIKIENDKFITAIGLSNTGELWIYDSVSNRIYLIDNNNTIQDESQIILYPSPENIVENKLIERENKLYVIDEINGIVVFNNLLNFDNQYTVENISKPTFTKDKIWYFDKITNKIISFDFKFRESTEIFDFLTKNIVPDIAMISENKIYFLYGNKIDYKVIQN